MALISVNPTTGETIRRYEENSLEEVAARIETAHQAFGEWRRQEIQFRAATLARAAGVLRTDREVYARLMALEMGKPIRDGRAEVDKCAWVCEYYAAHAADMLRPEPVVTDAVRSYVDFQPLGVLLGVMPWNFPFWQLFRFAAPAIMAGNTVLLKHAANVSGCAVALGELFARAGVPEGVFQVLLIASRKVASIIDHPLVRGVSLTGSIAAGRAVAKAAADRLKKTVLELGGSDPYIILEDAPLEETVAACAAGRLLNSGQSCIAAKRFIVLETIRDAFEKRLAEVMAAARMGDPLDEAVQIGPQARYELRDDLHRQVRESIRRGARCLVGGAIPEGTGAFYPPTVLTGVRKGMPVFDEETFGPVAAVVTAKDEADAVRIANASEFGLGAAVFTADPGRGERIARFDLEAGTCMVNAYVRSDPRLPFGGIKQSGLGRELSHYGIKEFVNIKTISVFDV
jgi:succinate-semialdehyde dehydrogenase / glutarate-semialdehyde dehydrogenase